MRKEELISSYRESRPFYQRFTDKMELLLRELIHNENIEYHLIESRTKELNSFQEKITRKQEKYSTLDEVTDLSALRIIVYYPTDIVKVVSLIEKEFLVDKKNSKISGEELNSNEFGYLSSHIVLSLGSNRKKLAEWKFHNDFKCEIQIRTVLQHAWASISHALQYKTKKDIPSNLQRKLFRLAGLFELADEQFVDIRKTHQELILEIDKEDIDKSDRELNLLTVANFIEKSQTVTEIYSTSLNSGFTDENEEPNMENTESDTMSELITVCEYVGIKSIKELENVFKSIPLNELKLLFHNQINFERDRDKGWYVSPSFILILVLIYKYVDKFNSKKLTDFGWHDPIAKRIINSSKMTKKTAHNNV